MKNRIFIDLAGSLIYMDDEEIPIDMKNTRNFYKKSLYLLNMIVDDENDYRSYNRLNAILYDFDNNIVTVEAEDKTGSKIERCHAIENLEQRYREIHEKCIPDTQTKIDAVFHKLRNEPSSREKAIKNFLSLREHYSDTYAEYLGMVESAGRMMLSSGLGDEYMTLEEHFVSYFDKKETIELYNRFTEDEIRVYMEDEESLRMISEMFVLLDEEYGDLLKMNLIFATVVEEIFTQMNEMTENKLS